MSLPIRSLPVVQHWDCQATGTCCKEYRVTLSEEEQQRIEKQNWTADDLDGHAPFRWVGWPWARKAQLNQTAEGCVFLSKEGRCRIHERFGYDAKPLPCRLFPFVLIPAGDHWRVGVRYACPSAAANKGRGIPEHLPELNAFADELARRENLTAQPDGSLAKPPPQDSGDKLDWSDTLRLVDSLVTMLENRREPLERRLRKMLSLAEQMRKVRLGDRRGSQLQELVNLLIVNADQEAAANLMMLPRPGWVGRILFRQAVSLFSRKDHGPNRGLARKGRLALFGAAIRFARGTGAIPRMHGGLPESTFEEAEVPRGPLPLEAEKILERYYLLKVASLQFCGSASFGLPFWEGLELLILTLPIVLFLSRMGKDRSRESAVIHALTIVDDHIGFNRVLASFRQRLALRIMVKSGELARLIGWYSR